MKKIPLTQGKVALVDDADYERLNCFNWYAQQNHCTFYAVRNVRVAEGKQGIQYMHRLILGLHASDIRRCDHRDGNGLNNQGDNLRVCTRSQNQQSQRNLRVGTSKYKGVSWHRRSGKWRPQIRVNKKGVYLGLFKSETEAAVAYNQAALKYFGEFALTNEF